MTTVDARAVMRAVRDRDPSERIRLLQTIKPRLPEQYVPHVPHPTQQLFLLQNGREVLFGGSAGGGKFQSSTTLTSIVYDEGMEPHKNDESKVCTPFGFKRLADIKVGDQVSNPDGTIARVIQVHEQGVQDIYRLTFIDGATCVAGADHKWLAHLSGKKLKAQRKMPTVNGWSDYVSNDTVMTTLQLKEHLDKAMKMPPGGGSRTGNGGVRGPAWPLIPLTEPVQFTVSSRNASARWPVDPYIVGVLLGDGSVSGRSKDRVTYTGMDPQIAQIIRDRVPGAVVDNNPESDSGKHWIIRVPGIGHALNDIGMSGCRAWEKFVPERYKVVPLEMRWALVQGLMDTDGYVDNRGHCSFLSTSEQLAKDVQWLTRSLGFKATITGPKTKTYTYLGEKKQGRPCWNVTIVGDRTRELFGIDRKRDRCRDGINGGYGARRRVTKIEKIGRATARCITVDHPNGLYITDDFIVTHNSDALLMSALAYVDVPGYNALILRRTWPDLSLPGAIMDRAREWLQGTDAEPRDGGRVWRFPSGARLSFGYLQHDKNKFNYQSAEFHYVAFDELTQFQESTYTYMFSRVRKPVVACARCKRPVQKYFADGIATVQWKHTESKTSRCDDPMPNPQSLREYGPAPDGTTLFDIPLRVRAASNPGGVGGAWVRDRFVNPATRVRGAVFIPSLLSDNPSLDQETYRHNLEHLNPVDRERLLNGDWDITEQGDYFQRHWFTFLDDIPRDTRIRWVRYWDLAATEKGDWTAGCLLGLTTEGQWIVADVRRMRGTPYEVERFIAATAATDGTGVAIRMEQEPGSSGVNTIDHYRRRVLVGYDFKPDKKTASKTVRANPVSSAAEAGNIILITGAWNREFLDEITVYPRGSHDDMTDSLTGAFSMLARTKGRLLV